jgi:hypothetical protein
MEEEPYEELFPTIEKHISFVPHKMLDSASSGRDLPSRKSSISSLSSCEEMAQPSPLSERSQCSRHHDQE